MITLLIIAASEGARPVKGLGVPRAHPPRLGYRCNTVFDANG
jgi:hypothetical protein